MSKARMLWALLLLAVAPATVVAQQQGTIQGTVVDASTLQPLVGAQVQIVGLNVGTLTNQQGRFQPVTVPAGPRTVRVSLIGYSAMDRAVDVPTSGAVSLDFAMEPSALALEGVVVTALGLERQARTLGVAAQALDETNLSQVAPNIVSSLSGQVSGVNITSAGTQGGSSRIVIRGENSLLGNNQPLFVIDGVPIDNYVGVAAGTVAGQGGYDYGTLIQDIAPESIESLTVLKGPNAAALYGSRASNGVVIIETKKGLGAVGGAEITASQTVTWENELRLPSYQNRYGQGNEGIYEYYDGDGGGAYDYVDESWGPPLDQGLMIPQFHSPVTGVDSNGRAILQPLPWVSSPNNVDDFFEQGNTLVTNVSVAAASERINGRFGFSRFDQDGLVPGFELDRTSLSFGGGMQATERFNVDTSLQYITQSGENRPAQSYDGNNPMSQFIWFGRQVDTKLLREKYLDRMPEGHPSAGYLFNWQRHYWNNPYYLQFANNNQDSRDRLIGQLSGSYQIAPWLNGMVRASTDWYQDKRLKAWAAENCCGTYTTNPLTSAREYVQPTGAFADWDLGFQENNYDMLLSATPQLDLPVTSVFNFGASRRDMERTNDYVWVGALATPGVYNVGNASVTPDAYVRSYRKRNNSVYGQAEFGYNNLAFLTFTGRNDWSSTLPEGNNSYFYPSVSGSFIFSDAIPALAASDFLSYGKLRASWARVGNDTDPYQLRNTYLADEIWEGNPTFTVPNALLNANLRPETTESIEIGAEVAVLDNRIGFDVTYYQEETRDQIMPVNISPSTGYLSRWLNAGTVRNRGVELLVTTVPVRTDNFQWRSSVTWSKNDNKVVELAEGVEGLEISLGSFWGAYVYARAGEPYGQLVGRAYQRSPDGRIIVNSAGLPLRTPGLEVIGNFAPDWRGGWSNEISYGPLRLNGLLDAKMGGDIFSVTKMWGTYTGVLEETADRGRCISAPNPDSSYPVCNEENGIIFDGVRRVVTGADTTYVENTRVQDGYTLGIYNNYFIQEANIIDASFVKLRELTLSYDIPESLTNRASLSGLQISVIGRNLWLWTPDENPHIDPETITEATNVQGFEYGQMPTPRSIGFTISVRP